MINFDTFYAEYKQDMRDLKKTIEDNHDAIQPKIDDLCNRLTKIETERDTTVKIHTGQIKTLKGVIGFLGGVFGIIQALHYLKVV